ncbi:guanine nucleotide-binding protein G(I)/G(S)/G(O) subunit gamma-7 isoform X1 [Psammomys obesus]|uniref:guanine nucleotide-binding protein G(I)/G(S)/G(O) subunit gamma-7 isoform X1 n=1 Tax=Psammomys obesus TaxID=48139 RepID=UPI002452E0ED|nr:guanine nucleotide-binding protein G(I)/G(S)/G(O) subunit gamma-7 isoform X1 [Psammomys obesus]
MSAWDGKGAQTAHPAPSLPAEELRPRRGLGGFGAEPRCWRRLAEQEPRCYGHTMACAGSRFQGAPSLTAPSGLDSCVPRRQTAAGGG